MSHPRPKTALILHGGGARAAYQVGVLKAVRELLPEQRITPFPILCGTSAGAINAAAMATWAEDFGTGVERLESLWAGLQAGDVYDAGVADMAGAMLRGLAAPVLGWIGRSPRSLLDTAPLRRRLEAELDLDRIEGAIARHALHSVSITCSGYASGQSVTFFQGRADLEPWRRPQRFGAHVKLSVDHVLASSAIPFVFPAVKLHREWFGDGSMRQLAPLSPAIHLGAERMLVIGAGHMAAEGERPENQDYPTLGQVAGHALSGIYLDGLTVDLERLVRINRDLALVPDETRRAHGLSQRHIDVLHIAPSQRLDHLAAEHAKALPGPVRALLRGLAATGRSGGALTSYLLFERSYTEALIALGYADALFRGDELRTFLS